MEYKRSRMDLESNSVSGTNSSSPSPIHNVSGGPFRGRYTRSSLGAVGSSASLSSRYSPYSSLGRDSSTGRRTIPVIRARRDDSGNGSSNTLSSSTTAQRIMETLASMSSPVHNAGKVRIDSVKSVKPLPLFGTSPFLSSPGTMLSANNKFSGPPKTLSPLLLPKSSPGGMQGGGNRSAWSLKCLSIPPKMVDFGTNTEESTLIGQHGGSVEKVSVNRKKIQEEEENVKVIASDFGSLIKELAKAKKANGEYEFDKAWVLEDIDEYLGSDQYEKDFEKPDEAMEEEEQEDITDHRKKEVKVDKLPNGEEEKTAVRGEKEEKSKGTSFSTFKSSDVKVEEKWECPSCMVFNKKSEVHCVCCSTPNPLGGAEKAENKGETAKFGFSSSKSSSFSSSSVPTTSNAIFGFGFGTSTATKPSKEETLTTASVSESPVTAVVKSLSPSTKSQHVSSNFSFGVPTPPSKPQQPTFNLSVTETSSSIPIPSLGTTTVSPSTRSGFKFGAIESKTAGSTSQDPKVTEVPPSTETKDGTTFSFLQSKASEVAEKKWECPTCMVFNKASDSSCICCSTPNPSGDKSVGKSQQESTIPKPSFQFGFTSSTSTQASASSLSSTTPSFNFGTLTPTKSGVKDRLAPAVSETSIAAAVNPVSSSLSTSFSAPAHPSTFSFGASTSSTAPSSAVPPSFTFGTSSTPVSSNISSAPSLNFGTNTTSSSSSFSFGATAPAPNTQAPGFGFGTSATPTTSTTPSFNFGSASVSSPPSTGMNFGGDIVSPTSQSTLGFGAAAASPPSSSTFSFEGTTATSAPSFNFGSIASSQAPGPVSFNFGTAVTSSTASSIGSAPGALNATAHPGLFQFAAPPSTGGGERRVIKTAKRRFIKP